MPHIRGTRKQRKTRSWAVLSRSLAEEREAKPDKLQRMLIQTMPKADLLNLLAEARGPSEMTCMAALSHVSYGQYDGQ